MSIRVVAVIMLGLVALGGCDRGPEAGGQSQDPPPKRSSAAQAETPARPSKAQAETPVRAQPKPRKDANGWLEQARACVRGPEARTELSLAYARAGNATRAVEMADAFNGDERDRAYTHIAELLSAVGQVDSALAIARRIGTAARRDSAYVTIGKHQAGFGDREGAKATAKLIGDEWQQNWVLQWLEKPVPAFDPSGFLGLAPTYPEINKAIKESNWEAARNMAPSAQFAARFYALRRIAWAQARSGDVDGVEAWINGLDSQEDRCWASMGAAIALIPKPQPPKPGAGAK